MKTKAINRFLSIVVALFLLVALLPTSAFAAGDITPFSLIGTGVTHFDATTRQLLPGNVKVFPSELIELPDTSSWFGEPDLPAGEYTPEIPNDQREYVIDGVKYTLAEIDVVLDYSTITGGEDVTYTFTDLDNLTPVTIPEEVDGVYLEYYWNWEEVGEVDPGDDDDQGGGRPTITNFIYSVDRTVAQGGSTVTPKKDGGTDYYVVKDSDGLTLNYDTSMDMTNLGFAFNFGDGSWDFLKANKEYILDETWVDLVFAFDDSIDVTTADFSAAKLDSDMFVLKGANADEWFTTNEAENTITVHCRWDQATANSIEDLDPMIYFNGLKLDLPSDWNGQDSITINNGGDVKGRVEIGVPDNTGYVQRNYIDIDGGAAEDTFVLTTNDKTSLPGMNKTIVLGDGTEVDKDNVAAGDTVKFQLESNVPENLEDYVDYTPDDPDIVPNSIGDAGKYTLVFHDEMHEKLALNENSIQVMLGDDEIADEYVTIGYAPTDDCTFEVTVDLAAMYNADVIDEDDFGVTPITVNYTATLNADEVAGAYTNTAWVVYPDGSSEHDTVTVYTYGIDIFKYDQGKGLEAADAGLDGAGFALYGTDSVTVAEDGTVTVKEDATALRTVTSENGGHATIGGLDEGTYYLVETKAPDGYVKSDTPLKIVIPEDADGTTYMVDVNFANTLIPHTGGMGTTMFTLGGAAILAAAGVLFIYSRKTRKDQEEN